MESQKAKVGERFVQLQTNGGKKVEKTQASTIYLLCLVG